MPRDGSNIYGAPAGTTATPSTTIESAKYNALVADLVADLNLARPIVAGGTGASTASSARTALGVAIGSDVQAYDAALTSIAALGTAADRGIFATAPNTFAEFILTSTSRALLTQSTIPEWRTTLGLGSAAVADLLDQDDMSGDDASAAPSQQSVKAYVDASVNAASISGGANTPSRSAGVAYQNTEGKPILVAVSTTNTSVRYARFSISPDNSTWYVANDPGLIGNGEAQACNAVVPTGWYYRLVASTGTETITTWLEYY